MRRICDVKRTNAFHSVAKDLFISFWGVHLCKSVDVREILLSSVRKVEVQCLSELPIVNYLSTWKILGLTTWAWLATIAPAVGMICE